jgi:hypothetical protein
MNDFAGSLGSPPTRPDIPERELPFEHTYAGPDDIKLRDELSVTLGRGNSATLRRVDGTCTPDVLVIADGILAAFVIVALGAAADDDRESRLPEPGAG